MMDNNIEYIQQQSKNIKDKYNKMYFDKPINKNDNINNPIYKQHSLINNSVNNITEKNDKTTKYDPYYNFLHKKGLISDNTKVKYNVNYINIDSTNRKKTPSTISDTTDELSNNSLTIINNILKITILKHNYKMNDLITLTGVTYDTRIIKTVVNNIQSIIFIEGNEYVKIKIFPNIQIPLLGINATTYNTSHMLVDISGFKGYPTEAFIGNIPLNQINKTHQVFLGIPNTIIGDELPSNDYFFIKLSKKFKGLINPLGYNISIKFRYYGGVPTNEINAEYPINSFHVKGHHIINKITTNHIYINLPRNGYFTDSFGGNNTYISLIKKLDIGYPKPNEYIISLENKFINVVQISMKSSEFPNTDYVFKSFPEENRNNRIYFQNIDDGTEVYFIEIEPGNYDPETLKSTLETKFINTIKTTIEPGTAYTATNYIQVNIDSNTNIVIFKSLKEAILQKPIIKILPTIEINDTTIGSSENYILTIQHTSHGLSIGTKIIITDAIEYLGISANILNKEHIITSIIDDNKYEITISHINLQIIKTQSNGGFAVKIYVPNIFRLRFDYSDTMGKQLGFRNPGNEISITKYATEISNRDLYQDEINIDEHGNTLNITNNSLQLSGDNYILMTCRELAGEELIGIINTGKIPNIFAKINLTGLPGRILYDTFISSPIFFYDPIHQLSELYFSFLSPNGTLFDFNNVEHSFTLEIVTLDNQPSNTGLSSTISLIH